MCWPPHIYLFILCFKCLRCNTIYDPHSPQISFDKYKFEGFFLINTKKIEFGVFRRFSSLEIIVFLLRVLGMKMIVVEIKQNHLSLNACKMQSSNNSINRCIGSPLLALFSVRIALNQCAIDVKGRLFSYARKFYICILQLEQNSSVQEASFDLRA